MLTWRACARMVSPTSSLVSRISTWGFALEILNREFRVERLLIEGGGRANGSFLRAGLIDEISLVICPAVDGTKGAPSVFDSGDEEADTPAPVRSMTLESSQVLEGGAVWLRYRLQSGRCAPAAIVPATKTVLKGTTL